MPQIYFNMSVLTEGLVVLTIFSGIILLLLFSLGNKEKVGCKNPNCKCKNKINGK